MKNWNDKEVICVDKTTQQPITIGDTIIDFRGEQHIVRRFEPPHKPSASGKIYTEQSSYGLYCHVFNCQYIEIEETSIVI